MRIPVSLVALIALSVITHADVKRDVVRYVAASTGAPSRLRGMAPKVMSSRGPQASGWSTVRGHSCSILKSIQRQPRGPG